MSTSQTLFEADKALGKARVNLSRVVTHTDLNINADYQRAMEAAHRLTLHAITLLSLAQPVVRALAEEFKRVEDERAEEDKRAAERQAMTARQGTEIGAAAQ